MPSNVREIDHYNSRGLMIWVGITLDGRTHRHIFARGTETAMRYRDEVLKPCVRLFEGPVRTTSKGLDWTYWVEEGFDYDSS
ncbi:transposable element Tcb2 transposase [Trichonephila clavipes]|nr:transposable element Tcb2 transposase [Trichonephila clavipes]